MWHMGKDQNSKDRDDDRLGRLSMHPLSLEEALKGMLDTPVPEDEQEPSGSDKGTEKPKKKRSKKSRKKK